MFYKVKSIVSINEVPVAILKKFTLGKKIPQEEKDKVAVELLKKEFSKYSNFSIGSFLGAQSVKTLSITSCFGTYQKLNFKIAAEMYFYKPYVKQIIDFKIASITPKGIQGNLFNFKVNVARELLCNVSPVFDPSKNTYDLGDKVKLKEKDNVRVKITNLTKENFSGSWYGSVNLIKGSCRNIGTGKIVKPIVVKKKA